MTRGNITIQRSYAYYDRVTFDDVLLTSTLDEKMYSRLHILDVTEARVRELQAVRLERTVKVAVNREPCGMQWRHTRNVGLGMAIREIKGGANRLLHAYSLPSPVLQSLHDVQPATCSQLLAQNWTLGHFHYVKSPFSFWCASSTLAATTVMWERATGNFMRRAAVNEVKAALHCDPHSPFRACTYSFLGPVHTPDRSPSR